MDFNQLKQHNTMLYEHQIDAKNKIYNAWCTCDSVMLQMPTGTGKTFMFASIVNDLLIDYKCRHQEIHILIVAHRVELLKQISNTLAEFHIPHGFIQGTREQHLWKRVQVASIMSLLSQKNYYSTLRQRFDYIIVDEAHHSLADTYIDLFKAFPGAKKLGVTATPWRFNNESFLSLYDKLVESPQISWYLSHNLLADFDYVSIRSDSDIQKLVNCSKVAPTGDYVISDLDNTFNNQRIRSKLYESYKRFAHGRKGIIYAINKEHASKIAGLYSSHGLKAVAIDCDTPKDEREALIRMFKEGLIDILVNVELFTEGFDCPDVSFIQLARPTRSLALYLQQVGRGLRIVEGKEKTIIIDNVGLYNRFGLPDADREWQMYFRGREEVEHLSHRGKESESSMGFDLDESRYDEDDEEMMVVRGANGLNSGERTANSEPKTFPPIIQELSLCNYFLLRGSHNSFKIYPFTKLKGRLTGGVGNFVYSYEETNPALRFGRDIHRNELALENDVKLRTIIGFCAMLLKLSTKDILDIEKLCRLAKTAPVESMDLFDLLMLVSKIEC